MDWWEQFLSGGLNRQTYQEGMLTMGGLSMGKPTGDSFGTQLDNVVTQPQSPSAMSGLGTISGAAAAAAAAPELPTVDNPEADTLDPGMSTNAMYGAGMGALQLWAGLNAAKHQTEMSNMQMKIKGEHIKMREIAAEAKHEVEMISLFQANEDMQEKVTQQLMEEAKMFRAKQAELQVFQSEKGMEGQSSDDMKQGLIGSHHAYRQIVLANAKKFDIAQMYKREGIFDRRNFEIAGFNLEKAGNYETDVNQAMAAAYFDVSLDAWDTYLNFTTA